MAKGQSAVDALILAAYAALSVSFNVHFTVTARIKNRTFSKNPLAVLAWMLLGINSLISLKVVSILPL